MDFCPFYFECINNCRFELLPISPERLQALQSFRKAADYQVKRGHYEQCQEHGYEQAADHRQRQRRRRPPPEWLHRLRKRRAGRPQFAQGDQFEENLPRFFFARPGRGGGDQLAREVAQAARRIAFAGGGFKSNR